MKNPEKRWTWKGFGQKATSQAASGAVSGAATAALIPDPTGTTIVIVASIGAAVNLGSGVVGDFVGYLWDDEPDRSFASVPLYTFVINLLLSTFMIFMYLVSGAEAELRVVIVVIAGLSGLISSTSARLIDDILIRNEMRRMY